MNKKIKNNEYKIGNLKNDLLKIKNLIDNY